MRPSTGPHESIPTTKSIKSRFFVKSDILSFNLMRGFLRAFLCIDIKGIVLSFCLITYVYTRISSDVKPMATKRG